MLTATEAADLRAKVPQASDRAKASGKRVAMAEHVGGPLDGITIALAEPVPAGGFYGWVVTRPRGLTQVLYTPTERPGVWRFAEYLEQRGNSEKPTPVPA